jgi:hypothetical protein
VWWITLLGAAAILILGQLTRAFDRADHIGVVAAASLTVISWWLVQQWGLNNLYELVPAFFLAAFAALAVSAITPISIEEQSQ